MAKIEMTLEELKEYIMNLPGDEIVRITIDGKEDEDGTDTENV